MADKDVRIKLSADTKEAIRSVREFERQVDKLGDMADQGQRRQDGFLSARQVQMYRRILREMEQAHENHQRKLEQLEQTYNRRKEGKEQQKLKELEKQLRKRQEALRNAEGGNKWGDVASPIIQEYHRSKVDEASQALNAYRNSDELKRSMTDISQLEAELNAMRSAVQQMQAERQRSQLHTGRIDNMHQVDPEMRRYMHGAAQAMGATGAIAGFGAYWNYTNNGIDMLRAQERATNTVALQGGFPVGGQVDGELRRFNYDIGEASNFDTLQTAMHQRTIISGGTTGNLEALENDTKAVQRFGRAYDMDPNEIAGGGALLQRMGTFKEGEQQRFANMIAGAISKNGMSGRQEEMLRATVSLAQSVSQGQAQFTEKQFNNVAGLQVALGEAVPTLKGERGASLLANMDNAIKNGGHQLDLLMGKGVEFTGLEGMTRLEELKEQGLSNPENLQRVLKGAQRMFGGNEDMTKWALKEQLGLQMNEYNALKESGFLDKIMEDPNSISAKDLEGIGATELAKQWGTYQNSETGKVDYLTSQSNNLNASHAQAADETAKTGRSIWHGMGDTTQHVLLPLSGIGVGVAGTLAGGALRRRLVNGVTRTLNPTVGGQGGWRNLFRGGGGTPPPTGGAPGASPILGPDGRPLSSPNASAGANAAGRGAGLLARAGGLLGAGGTAMGMYSGAKLGDSLGDWFWGHSAGDKVNPGNPLSNEVHEEGRQGAFFKLLGSDWQVRGDEPKAKEEKAPQAEAETSANLSSLNVDKFNVNNKDFASYFEKEVENRETGGSSSNNKSKEQVVRIIIEGNIDGMNSENQSKVSNSIKEYFTGMFSPYNSSPFRYNLAFDESRR